MAGLLPSGSEECWRREELLTKLFGALMCREPRVPPQRTNAALQQRLLQISPLSRAVSQKDVFQKVYL